MIIHDVPQGSAEWLKLRAGIPTASAFDQLITPTGNPSKSFDRYLHECLAERIVGKPLVNFSSGWMDRGSIVESEARAFYELKRDIDVRQVGLITNDARTIGASPDGLVGEEGFVEFKCPAPHTHVFYLLSEQGLSVDKAYRCQTQGQLWVSGLDLKECEEPRKWVDILSYFPGMPEALFRVERDEDFIKKLDNEVTRFSKVLENMTLQLIDRGIIKTKDPEREMEDVTGFITREDADFILRKHYPEMYAEAQRVQ